MDLIPFQGKRGCLPFIPTLQAYRRSETDDRSIMTYQCCHRGVVKDKEWKGLAHVAGAVRGWFGPRTVDPVDGVNHSSVVDGLRSAQVATLRDRHGESTHAWLTGGQPVQHGHLGASESASSQKLRKACIFCFVSPVSSPPSRNRIVSPTDSFNGLTLAPSSLGGHPNHPASTSGVLKT